MHHNIPVGKKHLGGRQYKNLPHEILNTDKYKTTRRSSMSKKLPNKVAIVTGASKGIGASIAKHLAAEGASVVVNYSSSKEGADRVVAEVTKAGGKAVAVQANVSKKTDI